MAQIAALQSEKRSRSPAQRQIDSQLLYELKKYRGQAIAQGVSNLKTGFEISTVGRVLVDIQARVTDELLQKIENSGGKIINSFAEYNAIRASIPLSQLEVLASLDDINFIQPAVKVEISVGIVKSEGDITHSADKGRTTFGVNGTGVKVGVLSGSYNCLGGANADIANGELPATGVTVLQELNDPRVGESCSGLYGDDEGRAMLQIIHSLAPGASLYFATAAGQPANFANNIRQLRAVGCDIIVDDGEYVNESPFEDDIVAQAVHEVVANGATYFSAAGNSGNFDQQTSSTWEGNFVNSGVTFSSNGKSGFLHNFGSGTTNQIISGADGNTTADRVDLFWSDPLGASSNDYDLYVFNPDGTLLASSTNVQNGSQDPYEHIDEVPVNSLVAVVLSNGQPRYLHLEHGGLRLNSSTPGGIKGHAASASALAVAAVDVRTTSPFPSPFTGGAANPVENFSSDGPRRIFYNPDGSPITPGNFLSTGGIVRQKPDIVAADGVVTTFPYNTGLNPFYGTSAAAPHAAAIAALLKSFKPSLTAGQIRTALISSALDIETPGVDRDSGWGITMALQALQFVQSKFILNVPGDFNSDGKSDLVWRNQATGQNTIWLMNGTTVVSSVETARVLDPNWQIVGTGDFNSDGKPDLVWRDQAAGQNLIWLMNGITVISSVNTTPVPDSNWQIVGTGDFNSDGKSDLVWRNQATGQNTIWLMNGTTVVSSVETARVSDPNWRIVGIGDFNSDGKPDLVWRDQAAGQNLIWLMNGITVVSSVNTTPVSDPNWQIVATGDFNSDGKSDLVWRDQAAGQNIIWLMNGTTVVSSVNTTPVPNPNWQIRGPR
jgi:hypothetical protein